MYWFYLTVNLPSFSVCLVFWLSLFVILLIVFCIDIFSLPIFLHFYLYFPLSFYVFSYLFHYLFMLLPIFSTIFFHIFTYLFHSLLPTNTLYISKERQFIKKMDMHGWKPSLVFPLCKVILIIKADSSRMKDRIRLKRGHTSASPDWSKIIIKKSLRKNTSDLSQCAVQICSWTGSMPFIRHEITSRPSHIWKQHPIPFLLQRDGEAHFSLFQRTKQTRWSLAPA